MTAAFFLLLREGLEAALIVGIVGAYLVKLGRRDGLRRVWIGVGAALALSVGRRAHRHAHRRPPADRRPGDARGARRLFAVAVLTWMLFWMRRQGRAMKGELEHGVDIALAQGTVTALAGLAFVAVAREGLETVLFLFALGAQTADLITSTLIGAALGLAVGDRHRLRDLRGRASGSTCAGSSPARA